MTNAEITRRLNNIEKDMALYAINEAKTVAEGLVMVAYGVLRYLDEQENTLKSGAKSKIGNHADIKRYAGLLDDIRGNLSDLY